MVMFRALVACILFASVMPGKALAQTCQSLATLQWVLGAWRTQDESSATLES